jgi:hypothetical protein
MTDLALNEAEKVKDALGLLENTDFSVLDPALYDSIPWAAIEAVVEKHFPAEIDCGQCEGTGTTDAMGYDEECPVCDGSGTIPNEDR